MISVLLRFTQLFIPETVQQPAPRQAGNICNVVGFWLAMPVAMGGLFWLVRASDWVVMVQQWKLLFYLGLLMVLFNRLPYFIVAEAGWGRFLDLTGSLDEVAVWTGVFLVGPGALWLGVFQDLVLFIYRFNTVKVNYIRWGALRNGVFTLVFFTSLPLVSLQFYQRMGGVYPLPFLTLGTLLQGFSTLASKAILEFGWWTVFLQFSRWVRMRIGDGEMGERMSVLFFLFLPSMALPFSTLSAGLYSQNGKGVFAFFVIGLVVVSVLVNRLSVSAERSRQQSHQIKQLEKIGRAFLDAPPDNGNVADLLKLYVPPMFAFANLEIRLYPSEVIYSSPDGYKTPQTAWDWMGQHEEAGIFPYKHQLPWIAPEDENGWILMPILDNRERKVIGGIYLGGYSFSVSTSKDTLEQQAPALKSLAAAVSSALQRAQIYQERLAYENVRQELRLAGEMQSSFLPCNLPDMPGWQLTAILKPAHGASGDFYDFFPLSDGRVALFIADVTDKGVGAALYMAICRTLIRTYAPENPTAPEEVLNSVNWRILDDTCANEFVTVFYGVLDLSNSQLTYANAGHNPPLLAKGSGLISLMRTGLPLGINDLTSWESRAVILDEGDLLLLYTDGVSDALNEKEEPFGEERLTDFINNHNRMDAADFQQALLETLQDFMGGADQFDDITLIVLKKEKQTDSLVGLTP